jgi:hypothetical protein
MDAYQIDRGRCDEFDGPRDRRGDHRRVDKDGHTEARRIALRGRGADCGKHTLRIA